MNERELMELAVEESKKSKAESAGPHPKVGAVVSRGEEVLATGYRGELGPGAHAEFCALEKLKNVVIAGATVHTTLEPCTWRQRHKPCSEHLHERQVGRVVIGILDPNRDIRGQGEWQLEDARIQIGKFDSDLVRVIKDLNHEFISYQLGLGIQIISPDLNELMHTNKIAVTGKYRTRPRPGDHVVLFVRQNVTYYPQKPITWDRDGTWTAAEVWINGSDNPIQYDLVVARVSGDVDVILRQYTHVFNVTGKWIGIDIESLPSGIEVLASTSVVRAGKK